MCLLNKTVLNFWFRSNNNIAVQYVNREFPELFPTQKRTLDKGKILGVRYITPQKFSQLLWNLEFHRKNCFKEIFRQKSLNSLLVEKKSVEVQLFPGWQTPPVSLSISSFATERSLSNSQSVSKFQSYIFYTIRIMRIGIYPLAKKIIRKIPF